MKNKDDIFDRYLDEKTIEMISDGFPVLTEEEKDRIFDSIERKININYEKSDKVTDSVDGVEKYERPQLVRIAGLAAAFAIIVGGLGGLSVCLHNFKKNAPPAPQPEITTEAVTVTTAQATVVSGLTTTYTTNTKTTVANNNKTTKSTTNSTTTKSSSAKNTTNSTTTEFSSTVPTTAAAAVVTTMSEVTVGIETTEPITTVIETTLPETTTEPVTTTLPPVTHHTAYTETIPENEARAIAETYSDAYIKIFDINQVLIGGTNHDLTLNYYTSSGVKMSQDFCKIDPSLYANMNELRDYYFSVVEYDEKVDKRLFGPEISSSDNAANVIFNSDHVEHSYITYNGELYGRCNNYEADGIQFGDNPIIAVGSHVKTGNDERDDTVITFTRYFTKKNLAANATGILIGLVEDVESPGGWRIYATEYLRNNPIID